MSSMVTSILVLTRAATAARTRSAVSSTGAPQYKTTWIEQ